MEELLKKINTGWIHYKFRSLEWHVLPVIENQLQFIKMFNHVSTNSSVSQSHSPEITDTRFPHSATQLELHLGCASLCASIK